MISLNSPLHQMLHWQSFLDMNILSCIYFHVVNWNILWDPVSFTSQICKGKTVNITLRTCWKNIFRCNSVLFGEHLRCGSDSLVLFSLNKCYLSYNLHVYNLCFKFLSDHSKCIFIFSHKVVYVYTIDLLKPKLVYLFILTIHNLICLIFNAQMM